MLQANVASYVGEQGRMKGVSMHIVGGGRPSGAGARRALTSALSDICVAVAQGLTRDQRLATSALQMFEIC
ncbi:hypothetical protein Sros01_31710 [Streptomyces roseochromogenus]|nr:hypothetical protein Sros01_31710 [Streptomyces roseochromogenus]